MTDVVIAGAGPVGAVLALELARHGVRSTVLDRAPRPSRHPKMDFVNGRSMELLDRLGLAADIRALGVPDDHPFTFLWLERFDAEPLSRWSYPSVREVRAAMAGGNDGSQPYQPYQRVMGSLLEALGRERLAAHPLVDFRPGWAFESVTQDGTGVRVTAVHEGRRETVEGSHLVGCDGAGSAVRAAVGIGVEELCPPVWHCDVFFRSTDPLLARHGRFFLANLAAGMTLVARDGSSLWTGTFPAPGNAPYAGDPVRELHHRLGVPLRVAEVIDVAHWQGRLGVARRYQAGRVFLAGDAAHQFFPTGGHGANTGIGDAVDLGWKLAAVRNGWAGPALLASYAAERRRVALLNREFCANLLEVWRRFPTLAAHGAGSAQLAGFLARERYQVGNVGVHFGQRYAGSPVVVPDGSPEPAWDWGAITPGSWPGSRLPSVRLADGTELYALLGSGLSLVDTSGTGAGKELAGAAEELGVPVAYLPVEDEAVRTVLERPLVLVRPDQHVAWRGWQPPEHPAAIVRAVCGR
jgi:2-polyprenyl-6-methoxyphenol hydroxylase-like FAD-dependent oxidoreductase